MGYGTVYNCKNCGECYAVMLGVGMNYPFVYDEIMEKIFKGEFGEDFQKIAEKTENVVVDAVNYLYVCEKCGYWGENHGLDLYQVKNENLIKENKDKSKNWIEGWRFFKHNTKDFWILKRVKWICPQCKSNMKRFGEIDKLPILKCSQCHEELVENGGFCWD